MNRLRFLREERKLTLRELSNQVNIDHSNISKIEHGKIGLTLDNARIFADFFGVTVDYLLGLSNDAYMKNSSVYCLNSNKTKKYTVDDIVSAQIGKDKVFLQVTNDKIIITEIQNFTETIYIKIKKA